MDVFKHFYNLWHDYNSFCEFLHNDWHLKDLLLSDDNWLHRLFYDPVNHFERLIHHIYKFINLFYFLFNYCFLYINFSLPYVNSTMFFRHYCFDLGIDFFHFFGQSWELMQLIDDLSKCFVQCNNFRNHSVDSDQLLSFYWHLHYSLYLLDFW